jgi:hypothetical protein
MHSTVRKLLCFSLALVFSFTTILAKAQRTASVASALPPPQITASHTIFISNGGGTNYFNAFTGGADRGYSQLFTALQQWNHYQIVQSPSQADLIFEIHAIAPAVDTGGYNGVLVYNPQLILRIIDSKTNALLWTATSNVKAAGGQKSRDKGFDQSVAVLVDHVRQLSGEQLNADQVRAVRSNNQTRTSAKVLYGVGIGAFVGLAIFGIYIVTHRSIPTLPTTPTCTDPPFCPV